MARIGDLRTALDAQVEAIASWLTIVPTAAWAMPSRLGEWTVHELAVHTALSPTVMLTALAAPRPSTKPLSVAAYTSQFHAAAADIAGRARAGASTTPAAGAAAALREAAGALVAGLEMLTEDPVLAGPRGPIRASDLLVTRVNELVVHSLDLSASLPDVPPVTLDRQALGIACRMLTGILAERVPGHTVEVRVPPYAAIQCVDGPRHTRGTPANVVEVHPVTWVELATGRLAWADAIATGRVSASGERADISAHLPVLS